MNNTHYERLLQLALTGDVAVAEPLLQAAQRRQDARGFILAEALGKPSHRRWLRLCRKLEEVSDEATLMSILDAAQPLLATRWPSPMRRAPQRWREALVRRGAAHAYWRVIRTLDCGGMSLGSIKAGYIANAEYLQEIETLDMRWCRLSTQAVEVLFTQASWPQLNALNLRSNRFGTAAVQALVSAPSLGRLASLNLWDNTIRDLGLTLLANAPYLASLTRLSLGACAIVDAGVEALTRAPLCRRLTLLDLRWNPIDERARQALVAALPATCVFRV